MKCLKDVEKYIEDRTMSENDTFVIDCNNCGACCKNIANIILNPRDVYRASKALNLSTEEFIDKYCNIYLGPESGLPMVKLNVDNGKCPLYEKKTCKIANAKPELCALSPIGRALKFEKNAKLSKVINKDAMKYIYTGLPCDGQHSSKYGNVKGVTYTVKEWLEQADIPFDDEFYILWTKVRICIVDAIKTAKTQFNIKSTIDSMLLAITTALYLQYETNEEFLPQFKSNLELLWLTFEIADLPVLSDME